MNRQVESTNQPISFQRCCLYVFPRLWLQGEAGDAFGRTIGGVNTENRVKQLRKEVEVRGELR